VANLPSIRGRGLLPGRRTHVHLSPDEQTALQVGRRHGQPVVLLVRAREMGQAGYHFYLSANGVWLTEKVPVEYLIFPSIPMESRGKMKSPRLTFALIHSPLVGQITWEPVATALRQGGRAVVVPTLIDDRETGAPYWQQDAESAAQAIHREAAGGSVILAGHSGAGPLLPAVRQALGKPVAAYLFVDAGLPQVGATRLQMMEAESAEWAAGFRTFLEAGGQFPAWSNEDLQEIIPDPSLRAGLVAQLRPRGLDFFTEPLPVFQGWPDAPCAYLHFSPVYDVHASTARALGWPVFHHPAGHFHMLVDPLAVADMLVKLIENLGILGN
jgi:hypothetical protein